MTTLQEIQLYRQRQLEKFKNREQIKLERQKQKYETMFKMAKLHLDDGLSYAVIGKRFGYTRQRVHQLLKEFAENPVIVRSTVSDNPVTVVTDVAA